MTLGLFLLVLGLSGCQRSDKASSSPTGTASQAKPVSAKAVTASSSTVQIASIPQSSTTLNIAASNNLRLVLPVLVADFSRLHPNIRINVKFDSPVNLYDNITAGSHDYDIFLSTNQVFPKLIYEQGLSRAASSSKYGKPFTFTRGQLVLYSSKHPLDATPTSTLDNFYLDHPNVSVLIANPQVSSYGVAAENWMLNQNLTSKLEHNIMYRPSIDEAFKLVADGGADFGFVGLSQVLAHQDDAKTNTIAAVPNIDSYAILPKDSYPAVLQDGIVLQKPAVSEQFVDYLLTAKAQDVLTDAGYLPICTASKLLPACK